MFYTGTFFLQIKWCNTSNVLHVWYTHVTGMKNMINLCLIICAQAAWCPQSRCRAPWRLRACYSPPGRWWTWTRPKCRSSRRSWPAQVLRPAQLHWWDRPQLLRPAERLKPAQLLRPSERLEPARLRLRPETVYFSRIFRWRRRRWPMHPSQLGLSTIVCYRRQTMSCRVRKEMISTGSRACSYQ